MSETEEKAKAGESVEEKRPAETRKLASEAEAPKPRKRRAETKKLEPDPEMAVDLPPPVSHLGLTREEMNWAAVAHASILITLVLGLGTGGLGTILGIAVPAIIWYVYRDKSEYVADQARQATVFQVAGMVALLALAVVGALLLVVGWTVSAVLVAVLIGLLLIPVALVLTLLYVVAVVGLPVAQVVYGCYAAVEAYNGRPFRYRWIADMIDRYQSQT
jgi:uncharacterized Tic20 family protein